MLTSCPQWGQTPEGGEKGTSMEGLTALCAFAHAVELRSFAAAGRRLGISASAVSKSVARLEDRYGVRLLNRTTRSISLTAEGAAFYDRCVRILVEIEEAELAIARRCASPRGLLRVDMPVALGRLGIIPALPRFLERCPQNRDRRQPQRWHNQLGQGGNRCRRSDRRGCRLAIDLASAGAAPLVHLRGA